MATPSPSRDPHVLEPGKSNSGRRLAVRLLVGDVYSSPKTLTAAAAENPAASHARRPAPAALEFQHAPVSRSSSREAQRAVVARKNLAPMPIARGIFPVTSDTTLVSPLSPSGSSSSSSSTYEESSSSSSQVCEKSKPMDDFFAIIKQFADEPGSSEPGEMEYLHAEAAMRRNGSVCGGADGGKPSAGGGNGRSKSELARQNTQKMEYGRQATMPNPSFYKSPPPAARRQIPDARSLPHRHQRQKSFAGGFPAEQSRGGGGPGSSPAHSLRSAIRGAVPRESRRMPSPSPSPPPPLPQPQQHHMRRHSRAGDMLESAPAPYHLPMSERPVTAGNGQPSNAPTPRQLSHRRSFTELVIAVEPERARLVCSASAAAADCPRPATAAVSRQHSFTVGAGSGKGATSASRDQREQAGGQREQQWREQQQELESLVDALRAEIRAKDQLLEASEKARVLLGEELRGAWEQLEFLEGVQGKVADLEREVEALRKRSFAPRRGGSSGDMGTGTGSGNRVAEMEWALGELTRKLAVMETELQRSDAQISELTGKMANRENELGRAKHALRQAELERDSLADEMKAVLASWDAESADIPTAAVVSSPESCEVRKHEAARFASALGEAQRELQAVKAQRDLVLMAVGQPRRQERQEQISQRGGSTNRTFSRSITPPPHSSVAVSSSGRSGPVELQRNYTMDAPQLGSRNRRFF